jgi:RNA polymerase sigma-70 factor (ECF subfamily)
MTGKNSGGNWLADFHAGTPGALEDFYRVYYPTVDRAVGRIIDGADRETVVHEVFLRVLSSAEFRQGLRGGSPAAWIGTVARNQAIDYRRRRGREIPQAEPSGRLDGDDSREEAATVARLLVERFRSEVLPEKWAPVFDACFVGELTQRQAADMLGMSRTTLLYQQHRIRALLRAFLLEEDA